MYRFKILFATIFLIFTFFGILALSVTEPTPNTESKKPLLTTSKTSLNQNQVKLYVLRQQKLKALVLDYFKKALEAGDIVGAGVSIVKGDSILFSDGFGKRSVEKNQQVNGKTIFRLGSLSKGFAGVLAADLKSEGKVAWEDKVSEYLPEFQLGDGTQTDKITLAHILSHSSGTPYHSFTNLVEAGLPLTTIAKRFDEVQLISEPGEMYSYQNAMFALSGEVMKKVTGKDITELLEDRFFEPLGMQTAITDYETLEQEDNVALPHVRKRNGWKSTKLTDSYYNAVAAGGINASPDDMAKWMRFLLGHNPEVMDSLELGEALTPRIAISIGRKYYKRWPGHLSSFYGLGWRIHTFKDEDANTQHTVWHHGGSVNHFRNEIAIYPEADMGICVLLNNNSKLARTVIPDLYQIVKEVYAMSPQMTQETLSDVVSLDPQ